MGCIPQLVVTKNLLQQLTYHVVVDKINVVIIMHTYLDAFLLAASVGINTVGGGGGPWDSHP